MKRNQKNYVISSGTEHDTNKFIDEQSKPMGKLKSKSNRIITMQLIRTGKPVSTNTGLYNPAKLDISMNTLNKLSRGK